MTLDLAKVDWTLILSVGHYLIIPALWWGWKQIKSAVAADISEIVVRKINGKYVSEGQFNLRLSALEEKLDKEHTQNSIRLAAIESKLSWLK